MAKSAKKSTIKVKKAKPAPKAKKPAKVKAAVKKVVKPVKKIAAKKEASKKEIVVKKPVERATPVVKKAEVSTQKPQHNLTIFPALTQRPIAHKQINPTAANKDDKTRYSDEELKDFETRIKTKLETSKEEFRILKETLNRNNDAGTDSTSGGNTKVLEDGAETAEKENLSQLAARQLKYITNLENALVRIKNGTYGICTVTGKLIPKERLYAVPHTTQSIEAKMMQHD
jgi:RNA polymerase-binding transcription factor DksA